MLLSKSKWSILDENWKISLLLMSTLKYRRFVWRLINLSPPPGQNGRHFAADIFKSIFRKEMFYILIKILLKFILKEPIDNKTPVRRQAVTRNNAEPVHWHIYAALGGDEFRALWRIYASVNISASEQVTTCRMVGAKALSEQMWAHRHFHPEE